MFNRTVACYNSTGNRIMCVFGKKNLTSNIYLSSFVTLPGKLRAFFFIVMKLRKCTNI